MQRFKNGVKVCLHLAVISAIYGAFQPDPPKHQVSADTPVAVTPSPSPGSASPTEPGSAPQPVEATDPLSSQAAASPLTLPPIELPPVFDPAAVTFRVRAEGFDLESRQNVQYDACAVPIGGDRFITVLHLVSRLDPLRSVKLEINGEWKAATFTPATGSSVAGRDLAFVAVAGVDLEGVELGTLEYRDPVLVYGLRTARAMNGLCVGSRDVSLEASEPGTANGDSGGGVFTCDGKLVGILSGTEKGEARAVKFSRLEATDLAFSARAAAPVAPQATAPVASPSCINGQCNQPAWTVPQMSRREQRRAGR